MPEHKPHSANVPGDFYVEDGCCTMCEVPFVEAPELFGKCQDPDGYQHCFVKRQPVTLDEVTNMMDTIRCAEFMCIRYRGSDRRIQLELINAEVGVVCDNLPSDLQSQVDKLESKRRDILAKKPWWKFWR